jgi:hypothetical protein
MSENKPLPIVGDELTANLTVPLRMAILYALCGLILLIKRDTSLWAFFYCIQYVAVFLTGFAAQLSFMLFGNSLLAVIFLSFLGWTIGFAVYHLWHWKAWIAPLIVVAFFLNSCGYTYWSLSQISFS